MVKKSASVIKVGIIYTVSNIIIKGMTFLTTPLFTRLMSQEKYGSFNNISSWANIITILFTLSLSSSISRARYDYDDNFNQYMSTIAILGSAVTLAFWTVIEMKMSFFVDLFDMNSMYIRSFLLYALFSPAIQILIAKYRMYNDYKKVIALTWLTLWVSTLSSLALTYLMSDKLAGRVIGNYVIIAVIDAFFWLYIIIRGRSFSFKMCKYACALSLPLLVHELSGVLLGSSDKIIINQLCGSAELALYSIAYTVSMIITVLLSSLNQAWVPWFFDRLSEKQFHRIRSIVPLYTGIFTVGCIFLMMIGPELILIFGGQSYMEAIYVIPPVCLAIELQFIYTLYVNIEFYLRKTVYISVATTGATIINILLNYMLIPVFGYTAAAYTTVIGYLFALIFHALVCRKTAYKNLFDPKCFIINIGVCLMGMGLSMFLYQFAYMRIILIVIVSILAGIIVLLKRKKLLSILER